MKNLLKNYFNFSRTERNGFWVLCVLLCVIISFRIALPFFSFERPYDFSAFEKQLDSLAKVAASLDTVADWLPEQSENAQPGYKKSREQLFNFDPNTLDALGWKKLGLHDKLIRTIHNFRNKGGKFKNKEDLKSIYGFSDVLYKKIEPYITIAATNPSAVVAREEKRYSPDFTVDLNTADTTQLIRLKRIGSKLAMRIVNYRSKLGGFWSVMQLKEVYGIDSSTFALVSPQCTVDETRIHKININFAEVNELKAHPYFSYNLANAIVQYRDRHGKFTELETLKKIVLINERVYEKIIPYLTLK